MSEKSDKTVLPEDEVRLKPFLGIRPGQYLACLYGVILLVILFFVLFYPGIKNPGSVIAIKSEPWGAAVLVDGVYMASAPCEIFVPAGQRRIELSLPGFRPEQIEKYIDGRIFASAFFPQKLEMRKKLESLSPAGAFITEAAEYSAWSFAGEPNAAYQIPQSLSEAAYRLGPYAADPAVRESMEDAISASARFAVTRAGLRDLIRAKSLLDNQGLSPSPLSLLGSAEDIIGFLEKNPEAALWLGAVLGGDSGLTSSSWYAKAAGANGADKQETTLSETPRDSIRAGLLNFRIIPGGLQLLGKNSPSGTTVETFYISETLISGPAWEAFLNDQGRWKKENTETLIHEGLVKKGYLEAPDLPAGVSGGERVSGISWYAARAFCEWLSASLPAQFASWEVRLPTEAEWEYAAKAAAQSSAGFKDSGLFWEWCEDPFVPLSFLSVSASAAALLSSPERSLRGGSLANPAGSVRPDTRASLPPSFCPPFVSARPVISPKGNRP